MPAYAFAELGQNQCTKGFLVSTRDMAKLKTLATMRSGKDESDLYGDAQKRRDVPLTF